MASNRNQCIHQVRSPRFAKKIWDEFKHQIYLGDEHLVKKHQAHAYDAIYKSAAKTIQADAQALG